LPPSTAGWLARSSSLVCLPACLQSIASISRSRSLFLRVPTTYSSTRPVIRHSLTRSVGLCWTIRATHTYTQLATSARVPSLAVSPRLVPSLWRNRRPSTYPCLRPFLSGTSTPPRLQSSSLQLASTSHIAHRTSHLASRPAGLPSNLPQPIWPRPPHCPASGLCDPPARSK
jgi:hypothetical protein